MQKERLKDVIEDIIYSNNFLEDGLFHGYINLTQFAKHILPSVTSRCENTEINIEAIKMCLSRIRRGISLPYQDTHIPAHCISVIKNTKLLSILNEEGTTVLSEIIAPHLDNNPSLISIENSEEAKLSGLVYKISKGFYFNGVPFLSIYNHNGFLYIILSEKDIKKGFSIISKI